MTYTRDHIPKTSIKRSGLKLEAEYITIHSTANLSSTALNERKWLENKQNTSQTGWHICVDDRGAVEAIPLQEVAWHGGDGNGGGNRKSIGLEICESGNRAKALENTIKLVAKMLFERSWSIDRLKRHYDWSGKNCPRILNYNNWEGWTKFKDRVFVELTMLLNEDEEEIEMRYNKVSELPDWAKPTIEKLMDKGYLVGEEDDNLNLSEDMVRLLVINDRAGIYK